MSSASYAFISYSSKDREFVLRLAEALRAQGCELWLDRWNIVGRDPFWDEIQRGIESCAHFVFVISPDSIDRSSGAFTELLHAASLRPTPVIVPVLARETPFDKLPILVSPGKYQIHDFVRLPFDDVTARVASALRATTIQTTPVEKYYKAQVRSEFGDAPNGPIPLTAPRSAPLGGAIILLSLLILVIFIGVVVLLMNRGEPTPVAVLPTQPTSITITHAPPPLPTPTNPNTALVPTIAPTPIGGSCPDTLRSRMVVGALGRVADGPSNRLNDRPARYRTDGTGAKFLKALEAGETFIVLGGPVCNETLAWWLVNYKGTIGFTAEGNSSGYWIEPVK